MQKIKPFNLRPFVYIAVSLCFGILSGYLFAFRKVFLGICLCILFCSLCASIFLKCFDKITIKKKVLLSLLLATLFVFGCGIFTHTVKNFDNANLNNHYFSVSAKVIETQESDNGKRLLIDDVIVDGIVEGKLNYKAYVYVVGESNIDVGDKIKFSSRLIDKDLIYEDRLATYDILRKVKYTASIMADEITITDKSLTIFERCNLFIRNTLKSGLDWQNFSVSYAMLTGNGEYMDTETLTSYRTAGVAHIFAVSGLHIGFLATALSFLFDKLKVSRLLKAIIITPILLLYSGICGFSASSIRAVIMCAMGLFASINGDRYDALSSVAIAGLIVLLIQPLQLFSVGFQLSFGVVLGMILLSKPIAKLFKFLPEKLANSLGAVISAFLSSLPICLSAFGYFSPLAILVNLIFIPLVSIIFTCLLILTLIGGIFNIPIIALFVPKYVLYFVNMCITAFDFSAFIVSGVIMGGFILFYYFALIIPSGIINLNKLTKIITTCVCVIICLVGSTVLTIDNNFTPKMFVVGSKYLSATLIDDKDQTILIASDFSRFSSMGRLKKIADANGIKNIDTVVFFEENSALAQEFLTKLNMVFTIDRICYYGERDKALEKVIEKSFGTKSQNFLDGQEFAISNMRLTYTLNGNAVVINAFERKSAIFSCSKTANFIGIEEDLDYLICGENSDIILNFYNAKQGISYRASNLHLDAESGGTLKIKLK